MTIASQFRSLLVRTKGLCFEGYGENAVPLIVSMVVAVTLALVLVLQ